MFGKWHSSKCSWHAQENLQNDLVLEDFAAVNNVDKVVSFINYVYFAGSCDIRLRQ
jgi:hypothetical protein